MWGNQTNLKTNLCQNNELAIVIYKSIVLQYDLLIGEGHVDKNG